MWYGRNHHAAFSRYKGYFMEQQKHNIRVCLADICLDYALRYPETKKYFEKYICAEPQDIENTVLTVTDELWERHRNVAESSISEAYTEFYALLGITSRALLKHGKCLFHGVAFLWRGKAWIITAPSGTGKTTQLRMWKKMLENEIEVWNAVRMNRYGSILLPGMARKIFPGRREENLLVSFTWNRRITTR